MQEPSAYLFEKGRSRYGRRSTMQELDCPQCMCSGFVEYSLNDLWAYECIMCTHIVLFRRRLERRPHVTTILT